MTLIVRMILFLITADEFTPVRVETPPSSKILSLTPPCAALRITRPVRNGFKFPGCNVAEAPSLWDILQVGAACACFASDPPRARGQHALLPHLHLRPASL